MPLIGRLSAAVSMWLAMKCDASNPICKIWKTRHLIDVVACPPPTAAARAARAAKGNGTSRYIGHLLAKGFPFD